MFLIFDLETTGLPIFNTSGKFRFHSFRYLNKYDSSRIVSISWILLDNSGNIRKQEYHIILPLDFAIDNASKAVEINGITSEIASEKGVPWDIMYKAFIEDVKKCHTLVAHNIQFDVSIMLSEMFRYNKQEGIEQFLAKNKLCTMKLGRIAMSQSRGPKLCDLYKHLYNEDMKNAHDASFDTLYCCRCFISMMHLQDVQNIILASS
jgi:DNA polymerase III epsilon subunit-like protein